MPTAIITRTAGQDGSHLAELLLSKGWHVVGMARQASSVSNKRIQNLLDVIRVILRDVTDPGSLLALLEEDQP